MDISKKIEAILFYKAEPLSKDELAKLLKSDTEMIEGGVASLRESLATRGLVLMEAGGKYTLGTASELHGLIEEIRKEELSRDLSKAALETLSIILYKNGAHRSYIDYVRGVNSNFILRVLSTRGLVEKTEDPKDKRRLIYKPTFDLLSFMGVARIEDLPNYKETLAKLDESYEAVASEALKETKDGEEEK